MKHLACVASVSVRFGSKELQCENFIFGSLPIFRAGKTPKIPFFAPKPHRNACYAGYETPGVSDACRCIHWYLMSISVIRHGSCFILGNGNGDIDNSEEILQPLLAAYPKVYFILSTALFTRF